MHILLKDLFLNVRGVKLIREVMSGHCKIIKVRRYFNLDLSKYVMKYVKKAIVVKIDREGREHITSDIRNIIHASLYWIIGCRMFSISRHLEEEGGEEREGERKVLEGEYIGVVPSENDLPWIIRMVIFRILWRMRYFSGFMDIQVI